MLSDLVSWSLLLFAILFEVSGTTCMKLSDGFSKLWPSIGVAVFYLLSLAALTLVLKKIDVSVAYAIWSGLGTALKMVSIALIIAGVVGLNLGGAH
jgi:small multidrug resistance pump